MGEVLVRMRLFRLLVRQLWGRGGKGPGHSPVREFVNPTSHTPFLGNVPRKTLLRGGGSGGLGRTVYGRGCRCGVYARDFDMNHV